jgi:hypothetical protein
MLLFEVLPGTQVPGNTAAVEVTQGDTKGSGEIAPQQTSRKLGLRKLQRPREISDEGARRCIGVRDRSRRLVWSHPPGRRNVLFQGVFEFVAEPRELSLSPRPGCPIVRL